MRMQWMAAVLMTVTGVLPCAARAAETEGKWVAEVSGVTLLEPVYARVSLERSGDTLTGMWGSETVKGTIKGSAVTIMLTGNDGEGGSLTGKIVADAGEGAGTMTGLGRRPGSAGGGRAPVPQEISWKLTRELVPPAKPREVNYEPTTFQAYYYAGNKPGIHIFPGDIVHTWAPDSGGTDKTLKRVALGGDPNIGPIYVEGALPGDTLVVHLIKIAPNRPTAQQGSRLMQYSVMPAYSLAAKYDQRFNGEYQLDNATGIATLTAPTPALKNFKVQMKPMLGCISVAPPGMEAFGGTHLGPYGGNLDYNGVVSGATMYFPVSHPGALFGFGDGHAAMGDGEVTQTGLETSMAVDFSVEVIKGYQTAQVREEDPEYIISFGVAGSLQEALKVSTAQLATWIKHDYGLTDSEVALFLGAEMKYEVTELVDPEFDVVSKVPKSALAMLVSQNKQ
ncbi:acetamidase/formamidase family protein [Granulicella tundricola]|uniref:Acetamidase/Formamidase n=1 Tax=Granulicella tundricola (strain ATCC BAA-1859 / DSM 23138 / MP5ACTX9) TaxID=1198114 RepID=E8X708_GRATM|nr:acetamidase/formamidase family protein [Granulicella tundricola]ADW71117.1 Acetamidase/Formamidase [Granulicella tundricola MP5ACTX9]